MICSTHSRERCHELPGRCPGRLALLRAVAARGVATVRMDCERPAGADEAAAALHAHIADLIGP
jgi:hypothetical protein